VRLEVYENREMCEKSGEMMLEMREKFESGEMMLEMGDELEVREKKAPRTTFGRREE